MGQYPNRSLADVCGQTLLDRQVAAVRSRFELSQVILVAGFEFDRMRLGCPDGVMIVENERYETTGSARSISLGLDHVLTNSVLVVYGDTFLNEELIRDFPLDRSWVIAGGGPGGVGMTADSGLVQRLDYGLPVPWSGVAFLSSRERVLFANVTSARRYDRLCGFEAVNEVIDSGGVFHAVRPADGEAVEVDCPKDLSRARQLTRRKLVLC